MKTTQVDMGKEGGRGDRRRVEIWERSGGKNWRHLRVGGGR